MLFNKGADSIRHKGNDKRKAWGQKVFTCPLSLRLYAGFLMKRFFFISAIFHGALLFLLFSWEVPLADRLLPKNILEVSLVEMIEKRIEDKIKEKKDQGARPAPLNKGKIAEKKDVEATRQVVPKNPEEKKENPKQEKIESNQMEAREEKPRVEEKIPSEERVLKAKGEEPLIVQVGLAPQTVEDGNSKEFTSSSEGPQISGGGGNSGTAFLASAGSGMEKEGIPIGIGGKGSGSGKGEGGSTRLSSLGTYSQEGDSILSEIMRRIEKVKRYPKAARRMGIEGKATVRFKLKPNGKVDSVEVVGSSGSGILDEASLETVQRAAPLPYKEGWLKVVIVFKIL